MNEAQSGLIFDGNKFACEPTLPFNAMAMPSFDKLTGSYGGSQVKNLLFKEKINQNKHFLGGRCIQYSDKNYA